jgi:hypothetical protein
MSTRWSDANEAELRIRLDAGETIPLISKALGRTQEAVRARMQRLGWARVGKASRHSTQTAHVARVKLTLSEAERINAWTVLFPTIVTHLRSYHEDADLTVDDLLDFCGLCTASILDRDTSFRTQRETRRKVATGAAFVTQWMRTLQSMRSRGPSSLLPDNLAETFHTDV